MKASFKILVDEYNEIKEALGRDPLQKEYIAYSNYGWRFKSIFGTYEKFQQISNIGMTEILSDPPETRKRKQDVDTAITKRQIIDFCIDYYKKEGKIPKAFPVYRHFDGRVIKKHWKEGYCGLLKELGKLGYSIEDRLEQASAYSNGRSRSKEQFIEQYLVYVKEYGKQPTVKEYRRYAHCSESTIRNKFGSYNNLVKLAGYQPLNSHFKSNEKPKPKKKALTVEYKKYPIKYNSVSVILKWARRRHLKESA